MFKKIRDFIRISRSGYFDRRYYLLNYPNIRREDIDPLWHYVASGWQESYNPSDQFDTEYYLRTNPDIKQSGVNPLVHFIQHGKREGRAPQPYRTGRASVPKISRRYGGVKKLLYKAGKFIYWRVPYRQRQQLVNWAYRNLGFILDGMPNYENWRNSQAFHNPPVESNLVDIDSVEPVSQVNGSIAVHLHIFYADLVSEFTGYLRNMPFPYDLLISAASDDAYELAKTTYRELPNCQQIRIERVDNRGRDVAPIFTAFGGALAEYDIIAHLHSKKSLYNLGATVGWRGYLCTTLFESEDRIRRIFNLLQGDDPHGIVYPQNYINLPYWANTWLANRHQAAMWSARLGFHELPRGYFDYPASSMFWARTDALTPLFQAEITLKDFPEEARQTDGTLAHTLERMFVISSVEQGMPPAIIMDKDNPSWSPWRFDRYINRPFESLVAMFHDPAIELIGFDIFDTLVCRPLLDPETTKKIVARRLGDDSGRQYLDSRSVAEQQARKVKGKDVDIHEIYEHMGKLTGLSGSDLESIKALEIQVERDSLSSRSDGITLYQEAIASRKRVAILSDMFLPQPVIEDILKNQGVSGWVELFLSSTVGLRKDSGELYNHVLSKYDLEPKQLMMVGDSERSDIQIPVDIGASSIHLMRPVELARGMPRFSSIISSHERKADIDDEITLGLVVNKNFAPVQFPNFDPDSLVEVSPHSWGYSLLGPLLTSFAEYLIRQAQEDGIERLYFLSREGKPIKEVYDFWAEGRTGAPQSEYLVISRRTAGFAAVSSIDDILNIARTTYFPNKIEKFLHTRYGLTLSDERWNEIAKSFDMDRTTVVSVQNKKIDTLEPVLRALEEDILAGVQKERNSLLQYLEQKGLTGSGGQAVVDIGYGGSVQGYLNKLLPGKVNGYYMVTDDRATNVREAHDVFLRGCFHEDVKPSSNAPVMFQYSFNLEKLLSTNEPQVEHYRTDESGRVSGQFRDLLPEELASAEIRNQLLAGALAYARNACQVRQSLLPDYQASIYTARMLLDAFLANISRYESDLLSQIVLDDYYCGRDLVS